jgi:hypothetical protein
MNTSAPDHAKATPLRRKRRQQQGVGAGSRWARITAPPGGVTRRRAWAMLETLVASVAAVALCAAFAPHDPLLIDSGFGWIWLVPVLIALRYGSIVGSVSGLVLLAAWYWLYPVRDGVHLLPVGFFFGGFVLTLLCGQFGDIWITRLREARIANDYLAERLSILTQPVHAAAVARAPRTGPDEPARDLARFAGAAARAGLDPGSACAAARRDCVARRAAVSRHRRAGVPVR